MCVGMTIEELFFSSLLIMFNEHNLLIGTGTMN